MPLVSKKCPACRGCMEYKRYKSKMYLYCDFCDRLFYRIPGAELKEKELTNENRHKFGI
jgi:hypothetical protein